VLAAGLAFAALAHSDQPAVESAQALFERYVALEQAYDPGLGQLYADQAFIRTRRKPPMGEAVEVTIPIAEYRSLLREQMAVARARGERSSYESVAYRPEGAFVRIDASRRSAGRSKSSAVSLLVGPSPGGSWLIYEEVSSAPPWER
jgi:hypothetical protein